MNYRQMMYLDAVVRYGSINHAAKALDVSQPNLSRAINKLEEEIGHHLLKRDVKGVQLTREGRRFYNLSHDIVRKTMALNQVYQTDADRQTLTFQLATFPQNVTQVIVRELVGQFAENDSYEMIVWNLGMKEFMEKVDAKAVFPMHFWKEYSIIEAMKNHPSSEGFRDKIMTIHKEGEEFIL